PSQLMSPAGQCKPETLRDLAFLFESTGQYHRAQLCYHDVIEQLPREGWGWHGLAWITWLISGTRRALTMMKKAICLAPDNLDYVFSYGWMMLF
ncbi:hypothetical protein MXD63_44240, partial [Frankia sp. Cpl3]|nr:hypothetical protein [Frankia sp. Cpl3]